MRRRAHGVREAVQAAQAAAAGSGKAALPLRHRVERVSVQATCAARCRPRPATMSSSSISAGDLHDAFGQAEAEAKSSRSAGVASITA